MKFDINNKDDFEDIISQIQFGRIFNPYAELYRGQTKDSYVLKPGIARFVDSIDKLRELERKIISEFQNLVLSSKETEKFIQLTEEGKFFENDWRWLEQMQHFGIATRLLGLDTKS